MCFAYSRVAYFFFLLVLFVSLFRFVSFVSFAFLLVSRVVCSFRIALFVVLLVIFVSYVSCRFICVRVRLVSFLFSLLSILFLLVLACRFSFRHFLAVICRLVIRLVLCLPLYAVSLFVLSFARPFLFVPFFAFCSYSSRVISSRYVLVRFTVSFFSSRHLLVRSYSF